MYESCNDKEKCPFASKPRLVRDGDTMHGDDNNIKTLNMEVVRESLAKTGRYQATAFKPTMWELEGGTTRNEIKCSFEQKSLTIFELCHEVMTAVHKKVDYYEDSDLDMDYIPGHFQKYYGVSESITSTRFIRSLFLVFAKAAKATDNNKEVSGSVSKRARLGDFKEVTVGMASANMPGGEKGHSYYSRMLTIYRFDNSVGEPMEIWFEKKSSTTGNE